jgi:hypothetical protein
VTKEKKPMPAQVKALMDELSQRFPDWHDLVAFIKTEPAEFRALLKKHRVNITDLGRRLKVN